MLRAQERDWLQPEEEIFLRKMIRKDIKELIKMEKMAEYRGKNQTSSEDSDDSVDLSRKRRIEEKVQFGSESDKDIDEYVMGKFKQQLANGELELVGDSDEEAEEEGEEERSELEFESGGIFSKNKERDDLVDD